MPETTPSPDQSPEKQIVLVKANGNGNGVTRQLFISSVTILGSLIAAGVIGLVVMYGQFQALKVSQKADHDQLVKMWNDVYVTRFSKGTSALPTRGVAKNVHPTVRVSNLPVPPQVQ